MLQNGAEHSDKVEEPAEEKHENGDGVLNVAQKFYQLANYVFSWLVKYTISMSMIIFF